MKIILSAILLLSTSVSFAMPSMANEKNFIELSQYEEVLKAVAHAGMAKTISSITNVKEGNNGGRIYIVKYLNFNDKCVEATYEVTTIQKRTKESDNFTSIEEISKVLGNISSPDERSCEWFF